MDVKYKLKNLVYITKLEPVSPASLGTEAGLPIFDNFIVAMIAGGICSAKRLSRR